MLACRSTRGRTGSGVPPLPAAVYAAALAGGTVDLPRGRYLVPSAAPLFCGPDTVLVGHGTELVAGLPGNGHIVRFDSQYLVQPDYVYPFDPPVVGPEPRWTRAVGPFFAADTEIEIAGPVHADVLAVLGVPGNVVLLALGMETYDPGETYTMAYREVASWAGSAAGGTLTLTQPVGLDIPYYGDYATALAAVGGAGYEHAWKVGPWDGWVHPADQPVTAGRRSRGYGDGILIGFAGGRPVSGRVEGVRFRWPASRPVPAGGLGVSGYLAGGIDVVGCHFADPCGVMVGETLSDRVRVIDCSSSGIHRNQVNGPGYLGYVSNFWGGNGHRVTGGDYRSLGTTLTNLEIGPRDVVFSGFTLASGRHAGMNTFQNGALFGVYGSTPRDVVFEDIVFDVPEANYGGLFGVQGASAGVTVRDITFVGRSPDYWPLDGSFLWDFEGTFSFDGLDYGDPEPFEFHDTIPAGTTYHKMPLGAGIYRGGTVTLSSLAGVTGVTAPDIALTFAGLTAPLPADRWEKLPLLFPSGQGAGQQYERAIQFFLAGGQAAITVTVAGTYHPLVA